jgi:hypothetical protein
LLITVEILWPVASLWPGNNSQFWSDKNAVAVSCGLYACSRHLRGEAINGQFRETVVREELYPKLLPSLWDSRKNVSSAYTEFFPPCWQNNTRYDRRPTDIPVLRDARSRLTQFPPCAYGVSPGFRLYVDKFVSTIMTGNCTVQVRDPQTREQFDNVRCVSAIASLEKIDCMRDTKSLTSTRCNTDSWWPGNLYNSGNATFDSISTIVSNFALAMTDGARVQPYPQLRHVPGTVWESTLCTEFSWPWLCFPAVLVVLTILALGCTISATGHQKDRPPLWKSSILPLLDGRVIGPGEIAFADSLDDMGRNAKNDSMVLEQAEDGWELKVTRDQGGDKSA